MPYRIVYDSGGSKRTNIPVRSARLAVLTAGAFAAFLILTNVFWPAGAQQLRNILIPGDPEITGAAFTEMVDQLQEGEPLPDALECFCREIFAHAKTADPS